MMSPLRPLVLLVLAVSSLHQPGSAAAPQLYDQETEDSASGVSVFVQGKSGSIRITSEKSGTMTVKMEEIKERDTNGNEVGKSGNTKHSFNNFAQLDFTFMPLRDTVYHGVNASVIEFYAPNIVETSELRVFIYLFKENGNFTIGNTYYDVSAGNVKFNMQLKNWKFCGHDVTCTQGQTQETGDFVDFMMSVKGSRDAKESETPPEVDPQLKTYDMGQGIEFYMATEILKDGVWENMRSGYPKFEQQGSKDQFYFAFPRATESLYDPLTNMDADNAAAAASMTSLSVLLALAAAVMLR